MKIMEVNFQYYVEDSNQNAPTSKRPGGEKILMDF